MENMTFEQAIARLEQIAQLLEGGQASLEDSLKLYEEGAALAAFCSGTLRDAEQKLTVIAPEEE